MPPDPTSGIPDCCIPRFDENPERIVIDSDGLLGALVISVTSNVTFTGITGPLDFTFGEYKILPETPPDVTSNMSGVPVPIPALNEFTVGGFNIENFANSETQRKKAALAIRQLMRSPDVIGHIEILDLPTLQALAAQVNADAQAANEANPAYEARLIPAPAGGTQNVGFLVKTSRVRIDAVSQERASDTFINPVNGEDETLHDRPPLVLRATVDPNGLTPHPVIVVVNHTAVVHRHRAGGRRGRACPRQTHCPGGVDREPVAGAADRQSGDADPLDRRLQRVSVQRRLHRSDRDPQGSADTRRPDRRRSEPGSGRTQLHQISPICCQPISSTASFSRGRHRSSITCW